MNSVLKRIVQSVIGIAFLLCAWRPANAAVVTFDDGGVTCPLDVQFAICSDGGLTFTNMTSSGYVYVWDGTSPNSNGTNNLIVGYDPTGFVRITKTGGGTFNLDSIDLAISWYDTNTTEGILINGSPLTITTTLTTYALNLNGVTSVDITGVASGVGYWSGDNIVYDATIPEPTSLTLFGAGALALGIIRRKRALR